MAVSSFHTISINFSLSLLYKYHFFFSLLVDISEPWSGPHAFMMKQTIETVFISANKIAFSCSTIFMWVNLYGVLNVWLLFVFVVGFFSSSSSSFGDSWSYLFSDNRSLADTLTACHSYVLVSNINRFVKRFQWNQSDHCNMHWLLNFMISKKKSHFICDIREFLAKKNSPNKNRRGLSASAVCLCD